MKQQLVERLNAINREFYREFAGEFDATRRSPWPGWNRVLGHVQRPRDVSILDVGCGNGRFGRFAEAELARTVRYVGVDSSTELLRAAGEAAGAEWTLVGADLLGDAWPPELEGLSFDLVVCFGVMHHIPGESNRRALIRRMADRVAEGGCLAVSFWQFGADERFGGRIVSWSDAGLPNMVGLEPGDHLLRWGQVEEGEPGRRPPLRYCHHCAPEEADRLIQGLGLERVDAYFSDGRTGDLNLYQLLART